MAFPETTILSTFTGVDSGTPVTGFGQMTGSISMYNNNTGTCEGFAVSTNYWTAQTFTPPFDAHVLWGHKGINNPYIGLVVAQSPGASFNGYTLSTAGDGTLLRVYRATAGDPYAVQIGSDISQSLGEGDGLGFRFNSDGTFDVYAKVGAGNWTYLATRGPDTTYTGAFYIAYLVSEPYTGTNPGQGVDDLAAGQVSLAAGPKLWPTLQGLRY